MTIRAITAVLTIAGSTLVLTACDEHQEQSGSVFFKALGVNDLAASSPAPAVAYVTEVVEEPKVDILWVVESRDDDARGYRGALYSRDFTKSSEAYAPTAPLAILLSLLLALSQEETK